jgi:thiol-disulfide isomerase/thioredoxin
MPNSDPTLADAPDTPPPSPDTSSAGGARRRGRPVGPLALFLITAVALAITIGVVALATRSDDSVDVTDALSGVDSGVVVPPGTSTAEVGEPAPEVMLNYLDGGSQKLSELRGRPVVLNFWGSSCAPCLQEMPAFQKVHESLGDEVTIVGVDVADTQESGDTMARRTGVAYRNARDPRSELFAVFTGIALPRTVLIDADGTVVASHSGALTEAGLTELLHEHDLIS